MWKGTEMYIPKRGYEDVSYDGVEYYPARALSERDQTLLDTTTAIGYDSTERGLGYFVTKWYDGIPCVNNICR